MQLPTVELRLPDWTAAHVEQAGRLESDAARMRFVIALAGENVRRATGGPFAAAIFESGTGALLSVGVNLVPSLRLSIMHAEIVAILLAQRRAGSYTLGGRSMPPHELVTSCEPCAMCLGAVLWSGVARLVCGAAKADAEAIGFDEGPVFDASWDYLAGRGIEVVREVERAAAREVLTAYAAGGGVIYNG
jgi:tRNA(Arg) A34 adenosine deaminase TadA